MEQMSDHLIYDPGGSGRFSNEVELGGLPIFTNHRAKDDENPLIISTTRLCTQFQQFTLAYFFINLLILTITLITPIIMPNSYSNINIIQKPQYNPTNLKPNLGNGYLICFKNSIVNSVIVISNNLKRLNPVLAALIFGIIVCLCALCGVSPYIRSLRLFSSVRCCQLGGGSVCGAGSDKFGDSIVTMIVIHFLVQDFILTIINYINSFSRLLMLNPVCGFSKWYQRLFFSARICNICRFRVLRLSVIIDTGFDFDFCLICFNTICYFYFLSIWNIFSFFVNNIQRSLIEPITWFWFRIWNVNRGDR